MDFSVIFVKSVQNPFSGLTRLKSQKFTNQLNLVVEHFLGEARIGGGQFFNSG